MTSSVAMVRRHYLPHLFFCWEHAAELGDMYWDLARGSGQKDGTLVELAVERGFLTGTFQRHRSLLRSLLSAESGRLVADERLLLLSVGSAHLARKFETFWSDIIEPLKGYWLTRVPFNRDITNPVLRFCCRVLLRNLIKNVFLAVFEAHFLLRSVGSSGSAGKSMAGLLLARWTSLFALLRRRGVGTLLLTGYLALLTEAVWEEFVTVFGCEIMQLFKRKIAGSGTVKRNDLIVFVLRQLATRPLLLSRLMYTAKPEYYESSMHALLDTVATKGGISGLYRGVVPLFAFYLTSKAISLLW